MVAINEQIYRDVASLLTEKIQGLVFFNGTVEYDTEEFYSGLTCTLIICRNEEGTLLSVMPVWWEFHLYMCDGEQPTDFDWNELSKYVV